MSQRPQDTLKKLTYIHTINTNIDINTKTGLKKPQLPVYYHLLLTISFTTNMLNKYNIIHERGNTKTG